MTKIPEINDILTDYIKTLNDLIPNTVEGLYLHGSIALDAFVENTSDIDFMTVLNRALSDDETVKLAKMHKQIVGKYPSPEMDGCYIQWKDIGKQASKVKDILYYNNGELSRGVYFNFNPVTWWIFQTKAINIIGPDIEQVPVVIQVHELTQYVLENMNTYWAQRIKVIEQTLNQVDQLTESEVDEELEWSVLGILRQLYTLREHDITSKLGAGEYALQTIPVQWHQIIKDAMEIRKGKKENKIKSDGERLVDAIGLMKYTLHYCNMHFGLGSEIQK